MNISIPHGEKGGKAMQARLSAVHPTAGATSLDLAATLSMPPSESTPVGLGSEQPLVKPDNSPAKRARNRRYELRVRL